MVRSISQGSLRTELFFDKEQASGELDQMAAQRRRRVSPPRPDPVVISGTMNISYQGRSLTFSARKVPLSASGTDHQNARNGGYSTCVTYRGSAFYFNTTEGAWIRRAFTELARNANSTQVTFNALVDN